MVCLCGCCLYRFDSDAMLSSDEENAAKTVPAVDESKKRKKVGDIGELLQ